MQHHIIHLAAILAFLYAFPKSGDLPLPGGFRPHRPQVSSSGVMCLGWLQ